MNVKRLARCYLPDFLCALLCILVISTTFDSTKGLTTPAESDFYRDMGAAQSILDGNGWGDSLYLGETPWYNPLTPLTTAAISSISGKPLSSIYTHAGVWVNILGGVCFYVFVSSIFGRWTAILALFSYLFLFRYECEIWHNATYSPWLWPLNFTQLFSFLCLASFWKSLNSNQLRWHIVCGLLLGLTFLGHSAPALIISSMVVAISLIAAWGAPSTEARSHIVRLFVIGTVSFFISSPFLIPLFIQYKFDVHNSAPMQYVHLYPGHVIRDLFSFRTVLALVGAASLILWYRNLNFTSMQRLYVLTLIGVTGSFLSYGMIALILDTKLGISLPKPFPSYHFHLYFTAWESVLFGIGLHVLLRKFFNKMDFFGDKPGRSFRCSVAITTLLLLSIGFLLPSYLERRDIVRYINKSNNLQSDQPTIELYEWALKNMAPKDVVLTNDKLGLYAIGAAGRKVVAIEPVFSNPYVDLESRVQDRLTMFNSLRNGDTQAFYRIASRYNVRYIATNNQTGYSRFTKNPCCWLEDNVDTSVLSLVFSSGNVRLYSISTSSGSQNHPI